MRKFIRYVICGREGMRAYLMYLGILFGGLFALHLLLLGVLIAENAAAEEFFIGLYEVFGSGGAAVGFAMLTDRLLHISVNMGVSRRAFLRGMLVISSLFALVTTAVYAVVFLLTDAFLRLFGCSCGWIGETLDLVYLERIDHLSPYDPRMIVFNLTAVFCIVLSMYAFALLFVALKNRFNLLAGLIVTGISAVFSYFEFFDSEFVNFSLLRPIAMKLGGMEWDYIAWSFGDRMLRLAAFVLLCFLLMYAVFALLARRVPVCGREEEGAV